MGVVPARPIVQTDGSAARPHPDSISAATVHKGRNGVLLSNPFFFSGRRNRQAELRENAIAKMCVGANGRRGASQLDGRPKQSLSLRENRVLAASVSRREDHAAQVTTTATGIAQCKRASSGRTSDHLDGTVAYGYLPHAFPQIELPEPFRQHVAWMQRWQTPEKSA